MLKLARHLNQGRHLGGNCDAIGKIIVSCTGLMCDKQPNFKQILKLEELEFADNFFGRVQKKETH